MSIKLFKLFALSSIAGVILRISDYSGALILLGKTAEWTDEMLTISFYIQLILSFTAFVIIGLILRKENDRKSFAQSATVLVVYYLVMFALEQTTQYFHVYSLIIYRLFIPVEIFTVITLALARLSTAETINWVYVIPSLFAPYLFVLFGKKVEKH